MDSKESYFFSICDEIFHTMPCGCVVLKRITTGDQSETDFLFMRANESFRSLFLIEQDLEACLLSESKIFKSDFVAYIKSHGWSKETVFEYKFEDSDVHLKVIIKSHGDEYLSILIHDISEYRHAERLIKDSNREYKALVGNLPGYVYKCKNTKDWPMIYISDRVYDITGYRAEQFTNNEIIFGDLIAFNEQSYVWNKIQQALNKRESFTIQYRLKHKDDSLHWVWERGYGIYSDDGRLLYLEGFTTDITELMSLKSNLYITENQYKTLFAKIPVSVMTFDKAGIVQNVNDYHMQHFARNYVTKNYYIGKSIYEVRGHKGDLYNELISRVLEGEVVIHEEMFIEEFTGGHSGYVNVRGVPLYDDKQKIIGGLLIREDVTERKQFYDDMKSMIQNLKRSQKVTQERSKEIEELNALLTESESELRKLNSDKDKFFSL